MWQRDLRLLFMFNYRKFKKSNEIKGYVGIWKKNRIDKIRRGGKDLN